ncbi:MAG TPA: hypothetical protein VFH68_27370 [Polyangia bacterium]|jgi:hypothetical protein|nr:hypothetical protein [Polyangia bacterium]
MRGAMRTIFRVIWGWSGAASLPWLAVLSFLVSIGVTGCAQTPLPAGPTPPSQSCGGNPCASLTCPSAYSCRVDAHCRASCQPERVGEKLF